MAQTCNGLCERLKPKGLSNNLRYTSGQKWCSLCGLFQITEKYVCQCCKTRLRSKPRSKRYELPRM
ncbi:MAG TPA: hypothetical protein VMW55_01885 [Nitrosopumilaceae archaeon]|nr:hypothetical protein [Nitrosopumilaceae archaeon]